MEPGDKSWKTDENRWVRGYECEINSALRVSCMLNLLDHHSLTSYF